MKSKKKNYLKLASSNWIITLTSTMIGVIFGLYLNNYNEKKSLYEDKVRALLQVSMELSENQKSLENYNDMLNKLFTEFNYFHTKHNDSIIIVHIDSIEIFKNKTQNIFQFNRYEKINSKTVRIKGNISLNLNSSLVTYSLSDITWKSYKQTNYLSITNFKCLTSIESLYEMQNDVNELNKKWNDDVFKGSLHQTSIPEEFMKEWRDLLFKQEMLLGVYEFKDGYIKDCS